MMEINRLIYINRRERTKSPNSYSFNSNHQERVILLMLLRLQTWLSGSRSFNQTIIDYFISSNMLELLDLAPEPLRNKIIDINTPSKQQKFNQIMAKLRERNAMNDILIRKYIKKAARRKVKFNEMADRIKENRIQNDCREKDRLQEEILYEEDGLRLTNQKTTEEFCSIQSHLKDSLKNTNHTLTEQAEEVDAKIPSFSNFDFCSSQPTELSPNKPKNNPLIKHDKDFNKYLKNVFFKQMVEKINTKNTIYADIGARKSQGRMKTEMYTSKYQLSIKSLIFGNQEGEEMKRKQFKDQNGKGRIDSVTNEKLKQMERCEKDYQFHDEKMSSKGMLPTIHTHQITKNRKLLQNYIRGNNERVIKQGELKSVTVSNQMQMSKGETPKKIGMSLRIQTIHLQRQK